MTYNAPELLLVGAAANLVLEGSPDKKIDGPPVFCAPNAAADEVTTDPDVWSIDSNW
jgi:hypothetical protein